MGNHRLSLHPSFNLKMVKYRYVIDASVLIDFFHSNILKVLFRLNAEWMISDLSILELIDPDTQTLISLGLQVLELDGEDIKNIIMIGEKYPALTVSDRAHLVLSKRKSAVLITGDQHLRQAAEKEGITVHGTLWLLDEMVSRCLLTPKQAASALQEMINKGRYLPAAECQKRITIWLGKK